MTNRSRIPLVEKSIQLIKENQASSGAYIASPAFPHYRYSWLRDGTFIAYAMDRWGEHDSARRFYTWCRDILLRYEDKARQVIAQLARGESAPEHHQFLHARYTAEGEEVPGDWGNFQLDGFGTWLWGISQHIQLTGHVELLSSFRQAMEITIDYLSACWALPNYDCWEESGERVHPATIAAIYGGLHAAAPFFPKRQGQLEQVCREMRQYVLSNGITEGHFTKSIGLTAVDASLLWISLPFGLVDLEDLTMVQTVRMIEQDLCVGNGVHRYAQDTYYGGGQWVLLSAWLGWYYLRVGERERAREILDWIESNFTTDGLPEQVQEHLLAPEQYDSWVRQAGKPAHPLLWSHAMYMVLAGEWDEKNTT